VEQQSRKKVQYALPLVFLVVLSAVTSAFGGSQQGRLSMVENAKVREFLRRHIGAPDEVTGKARYIAAKASLRGRGEREVIGYLFDSGGGMCGTGGCEAFVLTPDGDSYRLVTEIGPTRLPIRVLVPPQLEMEKAFVR